MRHRRDFFRSAATTGLALGLAAAGRPLIALPEPGKTPAAGDDVLLLNTALALEHEAIWAYGLAGRSGLLSAKAKDVGLLFQGSHEIHRDLVAEAIRRKGGTPVDAKKEYVFEVPLSTEKDILKLAFKLEVGAARAYISVVDKSRTGPCPPPPRRSCPTRSFTPRSSEASLAETSSHNSV